MAPEKRKRKKCVNAGKKCVNLGKKCINEFVGGNFGGWSGCENMETGVIIYLIRRR
jgi:hypothetical protein